MMLTGYSAKTSGVPKFYCIMLLYWGSRGLMVESRTLNPKFASLSLGPAGIVGGGGECTALSPPSIPRRGAFEQGTEPRLLPGCRSINDCSLLWVCVHGVCVCVCVCVFTVCVFTVCVCTLLCVCVCVCVHGVCVCVHGVCVCVCAPGWVKCRARILSMDNHTWLYVTSLSHYYQQALFSCIAFFIILLHCILFILLPCIVTFV